MAYAHALAPLTLRGVTLPNRIVRAAHGSLIGAAEPGGIGPAFIAYHEARARGGVGLSILEICSVHSSCMAPLQVFNPELPAGYERLLKAVRPHGMRVMQQLWHAGHSGRTVDGSPPWSASDIPSPAIGVVPQAMTKGMIDAVVEGYATGARIARAAGLDGIEVHAAHSYLIQQFLSPALNRRHDEYGGSLDNRMRFLMDVLTAVRAELGPDLLLSVRLSWDGMKAGLGLDENRRILAEVERRGLVDFVNFSKGSYFAMPDMIAPMSAPTGYQLDDAAEMGRDTALPRLVTGRFRTLEEADQVIRLGQAELVSMVRATIAEPALVRKSREGREAEVRPCIACNQACVGNINRPWSGGFVPMSCTVNPTTGLEHQAGDDDTIARVPHGKRLVVVGGGPAGLEAARIAALRGHEVVLLEADRRLGGQLNLARTAPFRHTIGDIVDWQEAQLNRLGVDVRLNCYAETADIVDLAPDCVVIATGSEPRMDGVSLFDPSQTTAGIGQAHVQSSHDYLANPPKTMHGPAVVFDDVGHYEAIAVAEALLARGAEHVTLVTRLNAVAPLLENMFVAEPARRRLHASGRFSVATNATIRSIGNGEVEIAECYGILRRTARADLVVLVSHNRCRRALHDALEGMVPERVLIGDAHAPRFLEVAIQEANMRMRSV